MDQDGDPHRQIAELEAEIEDLSGAMERCRKIAWTSKSVLVAGGVVVTAALVGVLRADGLTIIGGLAAIIGGIVVYGSNSTTEQQTADALRAAEALRATLIGQIEMRVVPVSQTLH